MRNLTFFYSKLNIVRVRVVDMINAHVSYLCVVAEIIKGGLKKQSKKCADADNVILTFIWTWHVGS